MVCSGLPSTWCERTCILCHVYLYIRCSTCTYCTLGIQNWKFNSIECNLCAPSYCFHIARKISAQILHWAQVSHPGQHSKLFEESNKTEMWAQCDASSKVFALWAQNTQAKLSSSSFRMLYKVPSQAHGTMNINTNMPLESNNTQCKTIS